jgi:hypothetical protein
MRVIEILQELPGGKMYLCCIPFSTAKCILCFLRTRVGQSPSFVRHYMADCIRCGEIEQLSKEAEKKPEWCRRYPDSRKRFPKSNVSSLRGF